MDLQYSLTTISDIPVTVPCNCMVNFSDINNTLTRTLRDAYEGTIRTTEGYVKYNSVKLISRTEGYYANCHTTGAMTFDCTFTCLVCRPYVGQQIICSVKNNNPVGILAEIHPFVILVPRSENATYIKELGKLERGNMIQVEVINYKTESNRQNGQIYLLICKYMGVVTKDPRNVYDEELHPVRLPTSVQYNLKVNDTQNKLSDQDINLSSVQSELISLLQKLDKYPSNPIHEDYWSKYHYVYDRYIDYGMIDRQLLSPQVYLEYWEIFSRFDSIINVNRSLNIYCASEVSLLVATDYRKQFKSGKNSKTVDDKFLCNVTSDNNFDKVVSILKNNGANRHNYQFTDEDLTKSELLKKYLNDYYETVDVGIYDLNLEDVPYNNTDVCNIDSISVKNVFINVLLSLYLQKDNAVAIFKVFHLRNSIIKDLLQILASCYSSIQIYKPSIAHNISCESYLVCSGYRPIAVNLRKRGNEMFDVFIDWNNMSDNLYPVGLFDNIYRDMEDTLSEYTRRWNNIQIRKFRDYIEHLQKLNENSLFYNENTLEKMHLEQEERTTDWCQRYQMPVKELIDANED